MRLDTAAQANTETVVNTYTAPNAGAYVDTGDYKIILLGRGTCRINDAAELLEDILGYSAVQAKGLIRVAPAEIACSLSLTQAQYIAQALTEYGMQVSVANEAGTYIDLDHFATSSVFDIQGNFLPAVAGVLALLGAANRVHHVAHWRRGPVPPLFSLRYRRPAPPPHFRRPPVHHAPKRPAAQGWGRMAAPKAPPRAPHSPGPAGPRATGGPHGPGGRGPGGGGRGPGGGSRGPGGGPGRR